jgi:hypothetical protein
LWDIGVFIWQRSQNPQEQTQKTTPLELQLVAYSIMVYIGTCGDLGLLLLLSGTVAGALALICKFVTD